MQLQMRICVNAYWIFWTPYPYRRGGDLFWPNSGPQLSQTRTRTHAHVPAQMQLQLKTATRDCTSAGHHQPPPPSSSLGKAKLKARAKEQMGPSTAAPSELLGKLFEGPGGKQAITEISANQFLNPGPINKHHQNLRANWMKSGIIGENWSPRGVGHYCLGFVCIETATEMSPRCPSFKKWPLVHPLSKMET